MVANAANIHVCKIHPEDDQVGLAWLSPVVTAG